MTTTAHEGRPENTEVAEHPTVASVAAVASTTDDVEAAEPTHPDRPVGVNLDTASIGTEEDATEQDVESPGSDPLSSADASDDGEE